MNEFHRKPKKRAHNAPENQSKNAYTAASLLLTAIGTLLIPQNPPFYLDVIVLCVALGFGIVGYQGSEKKR